MTFTCQLTGLIASAAFASGDRFVVGRWDSSPLGAFCDVMWARVDGERVLLVGGDRIGEFITAVYRFDRVDQVPLTCRWDDPVLRVLAGDVVLNLRAGRGWRIPLAGLRSAGVTRWVEAPVARAALGVRTFGISPSGVRQWYQADRYRPLVEASASVGGRDLGPLRRFDRLAGFGFSEPPRRPSIVHLRTRLEDGSGHLETVLDRLAGLHRGQ